jgi:hypothetical protein
MQLKTVMHNQHEQPTHWASKETILTQEQREVSGGERDHFLSRRYSSSSGGGSLVGDALSSSYPGNSGGSVGLAAIRWSDNDGSSSSSIWSSRKEDSSNFQSSYCSMGSSGTQQRMEAGLINGLNGLSFHDSQHSSQPRPSSLQLAAGRFQSSLGSSTTTTSTSLASVSSTATSIPGLAPAFSGSQYSSYNTASLSYDGSAMPSGPPPGFMSPITTSSYRPPSVVLDDDSNLDSSTNESTSRRRHRRKSHSNKTSVDTTNDSTESEALKLLLTNPTENSIDTACTSYSLASSKTPVMSGVERPILPAPTQYLPEEDSDDEDEDPSVKKRDWLLRMNRRLQEIPVGDLDPATIPLAAIMNSWAKTKSAQGASMVELWLNRAQQEYEAGNSRVLPTTKMYTMAGKSFQAFSVTTFETCHLMSCDYPFLSGCMGKKWRRWRSCYPCRSHSSAHEYSIPKGRTRESSSNHWYL